MDFEFARWNEPGDPTCAQFVGACVRVRRQRRAAERSLHFAVEWVCDLHAWRAVQPFDNPGNLVRFREAGGITAQTCVMSWRPSSVGFFCAAGACARVACVHVTLCACVGVGVSAAAHTRGCCAHCCVWHPQGCTRLRPCGERLCSRTTPSTGPCRAAARRRST